MNGVLYISWFTYHRRLVHILAASAAQGSLWGVVIQRLPAVAALQANHRHYSPFVYRSR